MHYLMGVTDYVKAPFDVESEAFPEAEFLSLGQEEKNCFDKETLSRVDGLLVWHVTIGKTVSQSLKKGSIVVRYGVGYDNIDIKQLTLNGIPFCNTPDYGIEEVADTTCAMILNLQRKVGLYDVECRYCTLGWQEQVKSSLRRVNTQKAGVIGVGRIGTAVINRLKPFGYEIHGFDPYVPSGHEKAIGYKRHSDLKELLAQCDIVAVCCLLNDETKGMIDEDFIRTMKSGSYLIVTSRGGIINNLQDIESALKCNHLMGAAFDVLPNEPPNYQNSLIKAWKEQQPWVRGRLIINPHCAYFSDEALYEMRYKASETARLYLKYGKLRNQVLG